MEGEGYEEWKEKGLGGRVMEDDETMSRENDGWMNGNKHE